MLVESMPTLSDVPRGDDAWVLDLAGRYCTAHQVHNSPQTYYRVTSLIRKRTILGPYSRTFPRVLWWS